MTIERPRLVLLPGMDGTGLLFGRFLKVLGSEFEVQVISYQPEVCSYQQVMGVLVSQIDTTKPYVLVAESFSSPAALMCVEISLTNLVGIVLVAGFATSPIQNRFLRGLLRKFSLIAMRLPVPAAFVGLLLNAASSEVQSTRRVIVSVPSTTLAARLRAVLDVDVHTTVPVPMLYLRANEDVLVRDSIVKILVQRYPSTQIVELSGRHLLLQSNPQKTADAVRLFVSSLPA